MRLFTKASGFILNGKQIHEYFKSLRNKVTALAPLELLKLVDRLRISVKVSGSGINAQADAVRNAVSKALVKFNADFKKPLRRSGFLTRDARKVERKKYGLKKARRAPQWQKR